MFTWFMLGGLILLFAPHEFTGKFQLAFVHVFRWPLSVGGNVALTARAAGLPKDSVANVSQIVTLDRGMLSERVGKVARAKLDLILAGIDIVLDRT